MSARRFVNGVDPSDVRRSMLARDRCGPTRKLRYRSPGAAENALESTRLARVQDHNARRRERRAYHCQFCNGWHLTSAE